MTFNPLVLADARTYVGGIDLTGYSNKINIQGTWEDLDATTFGSGGAKARAAGLADTLIDIAGFFEAGDPTQPDDSLWAAAAAPNSPVTIVPTQGIVGSLCYVSKAVELQYVPGGDVGKLMGFTSQLHGQQPLGRGAVLNPNGTARTVSGNGTGVQLAAAVLTGQCAYGNLHVFSVNDATATLTAKIQSSPDNTWASPTDRILFTGTSVVGGQAGLVVGPVTDTWWRVVWTIAGGTTPSFMFVASVGIGRK